MNVISNLNSVQVINKPCVCSNTMRLYSLSGLRGDDAKQGLCGYFAISQLSQLHMYFLSSIQANRDKLAILSTKFSFAIVCSLHGGVLIVTEPKNSADPSDIVGTTDYKSATVSMIPCVESMLSPQFFDAMSLHSASDA